MASIKKRPGGKYQACVQRAGFPSYSKTFATRREARQWASTASERTTM